MWIKVDEVLYFQNRIGLARIARRDLILQSRANMDLRRFAEDKEFNEDFVRMLLSKIYGNVTKWQLHTVMFNMEYQSIDILVSSPDFDTVPDGQRAPLLRTLAEISSDSVVTKVSL